MWRYKLPLLLTTLVAILAGCKKQDEHLKISGNVTFNGKEISEGSIAFESVPPDVRRVEAVIQGGKYKTSVLPGEMIVRIQGFRVVGERNFYASRTNRSSGPPNGPKLETKEQFIPAKYNIRSELKRTIDNSGETYDFELVP